MPIPEPSEYPATKAAFTFVGPSYQLLASRFEAADSRITSMVTFASTLTFSGATLAKAINPGIDYNAQWFYVALGAYIFSIVFGIAGRLQGSLALPDPAVHHRESLWRSEESFQAAAIYWAGEHLAANRQAIIVKANYGYAVMAFTVAEVFSLIFWIRG